MTVIVNSTGIVEKLSCKEMVELYNSLDPSGRQIRFFHDKPKGARLILLRMAAQQANDGEVSRCTGHCCEEFPLNWSLEKMRETAECGKDTVQVEDAKKIVDMVIPLDKASDGTQLYTCKHFDTKERRCTAYATRPNMCIDYPYNSGVCPNSGCTRSVYQHKRFLLLGEAPNARTQGHADRFLMPKVKGSRTADKLLKATGWTLEEYLSTWNRANLLSRSMPKEGKGRSFAVQEARRKAHAVVHRVAFFHEGGLVILGRRAASAFHWTPTGIGGRTTDPRRIDCIPFFEWREVFNSDNERCRAVIVPHTSGIVRWWNEEDNRKFARRFFQEMLDD